MRAYEFTDEIKSKLREEFEKVLTEESKRFENALKSASNDTFSIKINKTISVTNASEKSNKSATILFTDKAYMRMLALIMRTSDEVGWFAYTERIDDTTFRVTDIEVYDQTVTGSTVDSTEEQQIKFFENLSDEKGEMLHGQMHSHVTMGCHPSFVDRDQQKEYLSILPKDGYFIFMIWNKKLECWAEIYDRKNNVVYEDEDIIVDSFTDGESASINEFLDVAEARVKKAYESFYSGSTFTKVPSKGEKNTKKEEKRLEEIYAQIDKEIEEADEITFSDSVPYYSDWYRYYDRM